MMAKLDNQMAALAAMSPTQLREWGAEPPAPGVTAALLRRLLAQRLQERRHGALPALVARELERRASGESQPLQPRRPRALTPGTRLVREWQGRTIAVEVSDNGFVWEQQQYRSLSQIARKVTGAHWSGPRFFGLIRRG
jgi:hypothetical protein